MEEHVIHTKAESVRNVLRYISLFKDTIIVIHIDEDIIESHLFSSHIRDIAYLHQAGLKVMIVPGAKNQIDTMLNQAGISWKTVGNVRIADENAMPVIKMAAFDVSNKVMTQLAKEKLTAVIGNWVQARSKGVIDGVDYATAGEIDKIDIDALISILNDGFIPIFPCIGWNTNGKPINISSQALATELAVRLSANKLFFLSSSTPLEAAFWKTELSYTSEGFIPALNVEELKSFIQKNKDALAKNQKLYAQLQLALYACSNTVSRAHIVDGLEDGALLYEIYSDLGAGTMIYKSDYGHLRHMKEEDIPLVLSLMRPFVKLGILLPRTEQMLSAHLADYIVYELDGGIKACAALHVYDTTPRQAEISAVAVDQEYSHMGIGPKLVEHLLEEAQSAEIKDVFILTTQTSDWFEKLGFEQSSIDTLPSERRAIWTPERGSKVYRKTI